MTITVTVTVTITVTLTFLRSHYYKKKYALLFENLYCHCDNNGNSHYGKKIRMTVHITVTVTVTITVTRHVFMEFCNRFIAF